MPTETVNLSPREIVSELDRFIVGQHDAKRAVALALREALQTPGTRAVLVTPDRRLAGRVATELARYGVVVDDSAGEPLADLVDVLGITLGHRQEFAAAAAHQHVRAVAEIRFHDLPRSPARHEPRAHHRGHCGTGLMREQVTAAVRPPG